MLGVLSTPLAEQVPQRRGMLLSRLAGAKSLIVRPCRLSHYLEPACPLGVFSRRDGNVAVTAREDAANGTDHATDCRLFNELLCSWWSGLPIGAVGETADKLIGHGLKRREFDMAPKTGRSFAVKRRQCGGYRRHTGHLFSLVAARANGRVVVGLRHRPQQTMGIAAHVE